MTPVICRAALPEIQAGEENRAVGLRGELMEPPKERAAINGQRRRLDSPSYDRLLKGLVAGQV